MEDMTPDDRQEPRNQRGGWYVIKGIPVAVIATLLVQTVTVTWWLAGLDNRVAAVSIKQDKTDDKVEALTQTVNGGTVPNALNAQRITILEQTVAELRSRVAESERAGNGRELRVQRLESALNTTNARVRAQGER